MGDSNNINIRLHINIDVKNVLVDIIKLMLRIKTKATSFILALVSGDTDFALIFCKEDNITKQQNNPKSNGNQKSVVGVRFQLFG
ncbi:MAG: hypothetical protein IPJ13_01690 [Saprospiraceae bacterium]|nr:hypothetical protein [Saprospiraceae bacterium]